MKSPTFFFFFFFFFLSHDGFRSLELSLCSSVACHPCRYPQIFASPLQDVIDSPARRSSKLRITLHHPKDQRFQKTIVTSCILQMCSNSQSFLFRIMSYHVISRPYIFQDLFWSVMDRLGVQISHRHDWS